MRNMSLQSHKHSKKGTTLVELVVAMTLTAIFAVACIALIHPIESIYQRTEKTVRAQLLADTVVDSIRKECDDVQYDEEYSVWIASGTFDVSSEDDNKLFTKGVDLNTGDPGQILVIKRNNNYCEAIYSCLNISDENVQAVKDNAKTGTTTGHAVSRFETDPENRKAGIVHYGYYQAKDSGKGLYPFAAYDYTNPVTASTYGDYSVMLEFSNLTYRNDNTKNAKYPAFVECTVDVYDGDIRESGVISKGPIYSRKTAICFSANGSAQGTGSDIGGQPVNKKKDIKVVVDWVDDSNANNTRPTSAIKYVLYDNYDHILGTYELSDFTSDQKTFAFANIDTSNGVKIAVEPDPVNSNYLSASIMSTSYGFSISHEIIDTPDIRLIKGEKFRNLIGTDVTNVIFEKENMEHVSSGVFVGNVSIDANDNETEDYKLYIVEKNGKKIAYIHSKDGTFIANENCESMFNDCTKIESITGLTGLDTRSTTTMDKMFRNCGAEQDVNFTIDLRSFSFESCENINKMFYTDKSSSHIETIYFPEGRIDLKNVKKIDAVFSGSVGLKNLYNFNNIDFSGLVTNVAENAQSPYKNVFYKCNSIIKLDASDWDCSNLSNVNGLFGGLKNVEELDISGLNIPNCTSASISDLLTDCNSLKILKLNNWNISGVENLDSYFEGMTKLTEVYLNNCNTENVTSARALFNNCSSLTKVEMDGFIKENCTDIGSIFCNCKNLNSIKGLQSWNTSSVTSMEKTFYNCHINLNDNFSIDVSDFDFAQVTNMSGMFGGSGVAKITFPSNGNSAYVYANVTDISGLFQNCKGLATIEGFEKVSFPLITDASSLFGGCSSLTSVDFDMEMANVVKIDHMYSNCTSLSEVNLTMDFPKVTSATGIFSGCSNLTKATLDIDFDIVSSVSGLFDGCESLTTINLDLYAPGATSASRLFNGCKNLTNLTFDANLRSVTDISYMFSDCSKLKEVVTKDIDFSKVKNASHLFSGCSSLTTVKCDYNMPLVENLDYMFSGCTSLTSIDYRINMPNVKTINHMFDDCTGLTTMTLNWNLQSLTSANGLFNGCTGLRTVNLKFEFPKVTSVSGLFDGCTSLETVTLDLESESIKDLSNMFLNHSVLKTANLKLDVPSATKVSDMFKGCTGLATMTAELGIPKVTSMTNFFNGLSSLTTIDLSNSDFSGLTTSKQLFNNCKKLTHITMDGVDLSNCTSTGFTFNSCDAITHISMQRADVSSTNSISFLAKDTVKSVNVSGSNFSGVTSLSKCWGDKDRKLEEFIANDADFSGCTSAESMFAKCPELTKASFVGTSMNTCISYKYMFNNCHKLSNINFDGCDTSSVTDMKGMFKGCSILRFDSKSWDSWDTSNVTDMSEMFYDCCYDYLKNEDPALRAAYFYIDISNFDFSSVTTMEYMFTCGTDKNVDFKYDILDTIILPDGTNDNGNAENVTDTMYMFMRRSNMSEIRNLEHFKTSLNLKKARSMFSRVGCTELDISGLNFNNLQGDDNGSAWMFDNCPNLTTIYVNSNTDYYLSATFTGKGMFSNSEKLVGVDVTGEQPDFKYDKNKVTRKYARVCSAGIEGYFTAKT